MIGNIIIRILLAHVSFLILSVELSSIATINWIMESDTKANLILYMFYGELWDSFIFNGKCEKEEIE